LATLDFAPRKGSAPLQAVDLIAHEAYQAWYDTIHAPSRPYRPAMQILSEREDFLYYRAYDELGLANVVKRFRENVRG
jgi:hypothetical protein